MGYPGQKYRQEQAAKVKPHKGMAACLLPKDITEGNQMTPNNLRKAMGSLLNRLIKAMPNPGFPSGGMPMPGGNMPMPGFNNHPPFGGQHPGHGYNNQPSYPQPGQNPPQGMGQQPPFSTAGFDNPGRQYNFNAPPQPPPQNQALFNQPPPVQQAPQSQPLPPGASGSIQVSNFSGRKKALLIGINYFGTSAALRGCINDVKNVKDFICMHYHFSTDLMVILTDDQTHDPSRMPTRANIIQAMKWLVTDACPNDSLFFHFSGHGSQKEDKDGDEADGSDETICPLDYDKAGMIVDDEMNSILVQTLPPGCRLTAIFDCCHSGTALDLPYTYNKEGKLISYSPSKNVKNVAVDIGKKYLMGDMVGALQSLKSGVTSFTTGKKAEKISQQTRGTLADVVMFSGCEDCQTSADAVEQGVGNTGAMSHALIKALSNNPHNMSYLQLLTEVRKILKGKYTQVPQLSSGRPMDMNQCFN
ncbi:Ca(2+)-dependent cysteine protease, partial [Massospora cicadina]